MSTGTQGSVEGQRIGRYALIQRLAVGGMAELFLARKTGLQGFEKIVVLKRILPHLAGNADFVEMFLHEARLAASLEHPNVVHVSDFGRAGNDYFFVMAHVHGQDVLTILRAAYRRKEPLPLSHAVTITTGIAAGLHYAHEHVGLDGQPLGIVHRDISPANVLVTYDGHVKVVDFGIAKAVARTAVTQAGVRKGKAGYMSPEQCRGRDVDRRSDIFSMGVVLWEMTTMSRLFDGDNDLAVMNQIVHHDARRPSELVEGYPPALEAIVMRCLERDRGRRFQTAEQLQLALEAFAREHQLQCSTRHLATYMHALFAVQARSLPWMSGVMPQAQAQPEVDTPTLAVQSADDLEVPTHVSVPRHRAAAASGTALTPPPRTQPTPASWRTPTEAFDGAVTHSTLYGRSRSRAGWAVGGAIGGVLLAGAGVYAWKTRAQPEPPPPVSAAAAPTPAEPSAPAATAPTPEEVEAMLVLVNQPDPALALDYPRRHRLLEQLRALPGVAPRIDATVEVALDLRQAAQAPDPCAAFARALERFERAPRPALAAVLRAVRAPEGGDGCAGLETRRAALARAADGSAG